MTEIETQPPQTDGQANPLGFGRRLAFEREKLGLSVADIAARLRLHPKQVAAIEKEELPALPAPFLRGFVRNYAKEMRLDPVPLIADLNARLGPQPGEPSQTTRGTSSGRAASEHLSRPVVIVGVLIALVVFAVLGWLATHGDKPRATSAADSARLVAAVAPAAAPASEVSKPNPPPPGEAAQVVAPGSLQEATPALAPPANVAPVAAASAGQSAADLLRLNFSEHAWVEVTQADGRVVHSQLNEAGSEQRIDGKPPLRLVIGNASTVALDYKGKPVDLKPHTNVDNVARVTLN
jgi:cytoskeleton protein RodZ